MSPSCTPPACQLGGAVWVAPAAGLQEDHNMPPPICAYVKQELCHIAVAAQQQQYT